MGKKSDAKKEERKPRTLIAFDYLLGAYDKTRMGAMRFALTVMCGLNVPEEKRK